MSNEFNLTDFKNGTPVKTKEGHSCEFVAILPEGTPARLLVRFGGRMENYYLDGSYLRGVDNKEDLVMNGYFNHSR